MITYLRRILEALDHPDMINLILHYLLALPDPASRPPPANNGDTSVADARKRKSMDLATLMAESSDLSVTPLLFNLVDLSLACLRSHSQQTIRVTLQLVSSILKRHHRYAVLTLLRTESVDGGTRTMGAHNQEVEYFMSLAGAIGGQDNFDEVYENILQDAMTRLESHPCSLKLVAPKISTNNHDLPAIPDSLPGAPPDVASHTLRPDDPLLGSLLDILDTFFVNPIDTNLAVTETITDLAICGYMGIEGWLLRNPRTYTYDDSDDEPEPGADDDEQTRSRRRCRRRPQWSNASLPRILRVLAQLAEQVSRYREKIPRFDDLLQQRREAFQTADTAQTARKSRTRTSTPAPEARERVEESPARPSALEGFAQRILGELGSPSRSGSPRRRDKLGAGPPPTPPPKENPMDKAARSGSPGRGDGAVSSQAAAFAAVDQTILSKKVGIPGRVVVPIDFNKGDKKPEEAQEGQETEGDEQKEGKGEEVKEEAVSVSHVLTNALILQSFLMELAGLVQVRAGLFNEVRFV